MEALHLSNYTSLVSLWFLLCEHIKNRLRLYHVEASELSLCFTAWSYVSNYVGEEKVGCYYVTMHNASDRRRANYETSIVTQINRFTCRWVNHRNCDTQSVSSAMINRVPSSVSFPLACHTTGIDTPVSGPSLRILLTCADHFTCASLLIVKKMRDFGSNKQSFKIKCSCFKICVVLAGFLAV
ncbi:hypothetical protein PoB_004177700 [Plakobranchus ocellatus]|uniref:Uncharacterized protein n=1 Tax=Plakobranchus ocellatus TaxID=259542 RepID=A0AAV4B844_9GAST|nr:hypothetical protein PoB_004177700 [Plakobranchus ocellatus]